MAEERERLRPGLSFGVRHGWPVAALRGSGEQKVTTQQAGQRHSRAERKSVIFAADADHHDVVLRGAGTSLLPVPRSVSVMASLASGGVSRRHTLR
jgi:hypothetical protein